jgi:nitrogen regulatory protein P-II 1
LISPSTGSGHEGDDEVMKMIRAVIREERFDYVKKALEDRSIHGMTFWQVMGRGEQKGVSLQYRTGRMDIEFLPKMVVEVVVRDDQHADAVNAIKSGARTGKIGDGRIFVLPVEQSIRIRTDEIDI